MTHTARRIAAVGELLWDILPEGPQLGGAPANFAAMYAGLSTLCGDPATVDLIGSVGGDELGRRARERLLQRQVGVRCVTLDANHPTGTVDVAVDSSGQPQYRIHENVAWDHLTETPEAIALAASLDALCFGTLAQRHPASRTAIRKIVEATPATCLRVFDVNLRTPFWTPEVVRWGCVHATILKMNEDEAPQVLSAAVPDVPGATPLQIARRLLERFSIEMVAITRGQRGSLLVTRDSLHDHAGVSVAVADSIGAGDAFTAVLVRSVLDGRTLAASSEAANRWGAWTASQPGGMPVPDRETFWAIESAIQSTEG